MTFESVANKSTLKVRLLSFCTRVFAIVIQSRSMVRIKQRLDNPNWTTLSTIELPISGLHSILSVSSWYRSIYLSSNGIKRSNETRWINAIVEEWFNLGDRMDESRLMDSFLDVVSSLLGKDCDHLRGIVWIVLSNSSEFTTIQTMAVKS